MTCRDRECSSNGGAGFPCSSCLDEATGKTAIGQQTERSGVPNPETNVVTVELTREEAESLEVSVVEGLSHSPSNPPTEDDLYCPSCRAQAKLRASLERTGK